VRIAGIDVGSTTVKAVLVEDGEIRWQDYERHHTRQAEKTLEFLTRMEREGDFEPEADRVFFTGSGAGLIAPLVGGRQVQEVVAVAAAVERLHPDVRFVSEIGGEDMKTIFFTPSDQGSTKQVYMQSACSGGTGTFIEKAARKLEVAADALASMDYHGKTLHRISSKCGIFAEADANSLVKAGVAVDEIIASLFEAVVYQNLATLTKGNTPMPQVLLLGGPNLFFRGLQQAWRKHLLALWEERKVGLPRELPPEALVHVPDNALYYACLGCVEYAAKEASAAGRYMGTRNLGWWIAEGQHIEKSKHGVKALVADEEELSGFLARYGAPGGEGAKRRARPVGEAVVVGCDFGSTTTKAVVLSRDAELLHSCYAASRGNPIEDAKALMRGVRNAGFEEVAALAVTGYGKDLIKDILGADVPVVETVAHATAALHFFPDADAICDVGGCDVKIMLLSQRTVTDFRLNSQCSSGNGAFLQGVAERYGVPLGEYADRAFKARAMPALMMGCGVFLQSDIVNQQRKGWSADEIMAGLAAVLPLNVWVYAGQFQNLKAAGRKFVLQGGTHRNLAVVKAQVDFIRSKVPDADIVVHPYSGEAGAIGAALLAVERVQAGLPSRFRGFEAIEALDYVTTANDDTACRWCHMNCRRAFVDVRLPGGKGRSFGKLPLAEGWERVITGNSCSRGLIEDASELRIVKAELEEARRANPNIGELVREAGFRPPGTRT
jgi:predicted CoA-substrate-specific enzyme activase